MHDHIKERTLKIAAHLLDSRQTVRRIAKEFGVSKSTVHKDLTERLPKINPALSKEVKSVLEYINRFELEWRRSNQTKVHRKR